MTFLSFVLCKSCNVWREKKKKSIIVFLLVYWQTIIIIVVIIEVIGVIGWSFCCFKWYQNIKSCYLVWNTHRGTETKWRGGGGEGTRWEKKMRTWRLGRLANSKIKNYFRFLFFLSFLFLSFCVVLIFLRESKKQRKELKINVYVYKNRVDVFLFLFIYKYTYNSSYYFFFWLFLLKFKLDTCKICSFWHNLWNIL